MKSLLDEFKKFILHGNLLHLAVAFVIGAAFSKVSGAFTTVITSVIGKVLTLPSFKYWAPWDIPLGNLIDELINLVVVGFAMFLVVKAYNRFLEKPHAPPPPSEEIKLLTDIRDLLKNTGGLPVPTSLPVTGLANPIT